MTAEIVSVGTELLLGQIIDTHAPTMARILADCGISCTRRVTIGDNMERLVATLRDALSRADIVVTVGGLGPTQDDITRDGIAVALDDELELVPELEERLREIFSIRKIKWVDSNLRQATKPKSGTAIDNPNGTAPGLICEKDGKIVIALPGPKNEFNPMADGPVRRYLERVQGGQVIHSRTLRICGIGESAVEEMVKELMQGSNPTVAPYAQPAEVHLRVTARAASRPEADALIDPVEEQLRTILGSAIYGVNHTTLEAATLAMLRECGEKVAVAESLTGGWLGMRLTSVAGSSEVFVGGAITYTIPLKESLLGVSKEILDGPGPVSEECARAMAEGARDRFGATYGVSLTGNAGPTSDDGKTPVGLVYLGLATPEGVEVESVTFRGQRDDIRQRSTQWALVKLRDKLLGR